MNEPRGRSLVARFCEGFLRIVSLRPTAMKFDGTFFTDAFVTPNHHWQRARQVNWLCGKLEKQVVTTK